MWYEDLRTHICMKEDIEQSVSPYGETKQVIKQVGDYLRRAGLR